MTRSIGLSAGLLALAATGAQAQSLARAPAPELGGPFTAQLPSQRVAAPPSGLSLAQAGVSPGSGPGTAAASSGAGAGGEVKDSRNDPAVKGDDGVPLEMRNPAQGKSTVWYVQTSLYTQHFHPDEAHQNHQRLIDIEYWRDDGWLGGFAWFKNSFGQPTQYLFVGKRWRPFDSVPRAYVRVAGGLLHGYKGEYRDRLPFNSSGVAPVILPGIGYSGRRFGSELIFFGTNGVMLTLGAYLY